MNTLEHIAFSNLRFLQNKDDFLSNKYSLKNQRFCKCEDTFDTIYSFQELEKHRNETTFRPFIFAKNYLRDVGIELTNSDDYDYAWVAQASIIDKKKPLKEYQGVLLKSL